MNSTNRFLRVVTLAALAASGTAGSSWSASFTPASVGLMTGIQALARRTESAGAVTLPRLEAFVAIARLDPGSAHDRLVLGALAAELPQNFSAGLEAALQDSRCPPATIAALTDIVWDAHQKAAPAVQKTVSARARELTAAFVGGSIGAAELSREAAELGRFELYGGNVEAKKVQELARSARLTKTAASAQTLAERLRGQSPSVKILLDETEPINAGRERQPDGALDEMLKAAAASGSLTVIRSNNSGAERLGAEARGLKAVPQDLSAAPLEAAEKPAEEKGPSPERLLSELLHRWETAPFQYKNGYGQDVFITKVPDQLLLPLARTINFILSVQLSPEARRAEDRAAARTRSRSLSQAWDLPGRGLALMTSRPKARVLADINEALSSPARRVGPYPADIEWLRAHAQDPEVLAWLTSSETLDERAKALERFFNP